MFGLKYGNVPQPPEAPPPVKITSEIARKKLREKLSKLQDARKDVTKLEAAQQRAAKLHGEASRAVTDATQRLEAARQAHAGKMASALSAGSDPGGASPAVTDARVKLKEAEDYQEAAAGALRRIEEDLEAATSKADALKSISFELADVIADDVDALYEAALKKILEVVKMRAALAFCLRSNLCRDPVAVNHLLTMSALEHQVRNQSPPPPAWQEAADVSAWVAGIEKMKSDPDAKFPVLK